MDHLVEYGVRPIQVYFILDDHEEEIRELLANKDFGYQSFVGFLRKRRWNISGDGRLVDAASESGKNGHGRPPKTNGYDMPRILQAWLFFALIATIVRTDETLFELKHLVEGGVRGSKFLNTRILPEKLQKWHDWIKTSPNVQQRLIDADRTLELARRVVRANLVDPKFTSETDTSLSSVAVTRNGVNSSNNSSDHEDLSDSDSSEIESDEVTRPELALCLMLLGETLSAAKTQIVNDLGLKINGWLTNDDSGWGPPAYVLNKMNGKMDGKKWCPRTQRVLRGQLGSSAFLLFIALEQHKPGGDSYSHYQCSPEKCLASPRSASRSAERSDNGKEKLSYGPQHHKENKLCLGSKRCCERKPDMKDVHRILSRADAATESYEFPIFRIITNECSGRVEGLTVETWNHDPQRECRRPDFAAISHMWSQGMGRVVITSVGRQSVYQLSVVSQSIDQYFN